jgi:hypothetical protein
MHATGRSLDSFGPILAIRRFAMTTKLAIAFLPVLALNAQTASRLSLLSMQSSRTIRFSGEVALGQEFRMTLNSDLEFLLRQSWVRGWTIAIVPRHARNEAQCDEFASVVTAPYRAHRSLDIDTSYGWTAEDEVALSPREFSFVTNCRDYRTEFERLYIVTWPSSAPDGYEDALLKLGTSPQGKGRLWITDSRISHTADTPQTSSGAIEWMKFDVEISLPAK